MNIFICTFSTFVYCSSYDRQPPFAKEKTYLTEDDGQIQHCLRMGNLIPARKCEKIEISLEKNMFSSTDKSIYPILEKTFASENKSEMPSLNRNYSGVKKTSNDTHNGLKSVIGISDDLICSKDNYDEIQSIGDKPYNLRFFNDKPNDKKRINDKPYNLRCINSKTYDLRCFNDNPNDKKCINDKQSIGDKKYDLRCINDKPNDKKCINDKPNDKQTIGDKKYDLRCINDKPNDKKCINDKPNDKQTINSKTYDLRCINDKPYDLRCINYKPYNLRCINDKPNDKKCINDKPYDLRSNNGNFSALSKDKPNQHVKNKSRHDLRHGKSQFNITILNTIKDKHPSDDKINSSFIAEKRDYSLKKREPDSLEDMLQSKKSRSCIDKIENKDKIAEDLQLNKQDSKSSLHDNWLYDMITESDNPKEFHIFSDFSSKKPENSNPKRKNSSIEILKWDEDTHIKKKRMITRSKSSVYINKDDIDDQNIEFAKIDQNKRNKSLKLTGSCIILDKIEKNKQPSEKNKQPSEEDKQPSEEDKQQSEEDKQQSEEDKQPSEEDKHPSEEDKHPSEEDKHPSEEDKQLSEEDKQPSEEDKYPSEEDKHPSEEDKQLSEEDKQPSEEDKQPSEEDKHPSEEDKHPSEEDKHRESFARHNDFFCKNFNAYNVINLLDSINDTENREIRFLDKLNENTSHQNDTGPKKEELCIKNPMPESKYTKIQALNCVLDNMLNDILIGYPSITIHMNRYSEHNREPKNDCSDIKSEKPSPFIKSRNKKDRYANVHKEIVKKYWKDNHENMRLAIHDEYNFFFKIFNNNLRQKLDFLRPEDRGNLLIYDNIDIYKRRFDSAIDIINLNTKAVFKKMIFKQKLAIYKNMDFMFIYFKNLNNYVKNIFPEIRIVRNLYLLNFGKHPIFGRKLWAAETIIQALSEKCNHLENIFPYEHLSAKDKILSRMIIDIRLGYVLDLFNFMHVKKIHISIYAILCFKSYLSRIRGCYDRKEEYDMFERLFKMSEVVLFQILDENFVNKKLDVGNFEI